MAYRYGCTVHKEVGLYAALLSAMKPEALVCPTERREDGGDTEIWTPSALYLYDRWKSMWCQGARGRLDGEYLNRLRSGIEAMRAD